MIEQKYISGIYGRLSVMDIQLDPNPIEFGPSVLNEKVAICRKYLSDTEKVFMEVSQNLHKYKRDLLIQQNAFRMGVDRLIAEDPHVRSGRSEREREALASMRMLDVSEKINDLGLSVNDLEELQKIIKAKRTDLKDIQGRLKDQLKLCQEQIALGQRWGTKKPHEIEEITDDLDQVFAEALGFPSTPSVVTDQVQEEPEEEVSTSEVDDFLAKVSSSDDVDEDVLDILNNL
jgi:hypothetical protein